MRAAKTRRFRTSIFGRRGAKRAFGLFRGAMPHTVTNHAEQDGHIAVDLAYIGRSCATFTDDTSFWSTRRGFLALLLFIGPMCAPRAGEVYKSIDAQGHVVYTDHADTSTAQKSVVTVDR